MSYCLRFFRPVLANPPHDFLYFSDSIVLVLAVSLSICLSLPLSLSVFFLSPLAAFTLIWHSVLSAKKWANAVYLLNVFNDSHADPNCRQMETPGDARISCLQFAADKVPSCAALVRRC